MRLRVLTPVPVQSLQAFQNVHMSENQWKTQRCSEVENWQKADERARCPVYRNSAARDEADLHAVVRAGKELSRPARGSQNSLWRHRTVGLLLCHLRQTTYTHFNPERGSGVDEKKEKASLSVPMTELLEDLTNRA